MNKLKSFRLPVTIVKRLEQLAKKTNRAETFYVLKALEVYFEDHLDAQIAKDRFDDPKKRLMASDEFWSKVDA
jgi:predicted DNA-binding protein